MKTKLEMAHEYAIALLRSDSENMEFDKFIQLCWNYADTMQAEADKRENKTKPETLRVVQQTFINGVEQPRYATSTSDQKRTPKVSRFERSDAVKEVLNRAENMGLIKPKEPRETHKNLAEFTMYPEYDASINYPPGAWVMYNGEKRLAVSIKEEWQPDWSQAPEWANWWVATANQSGKITGGWFYDVKPEFGFGVGPSVYYSMNGNNNVISADSFGYKGDWRNSLRKRPQ